MDGLSGGLAKPRVASSVVLSREGRKGRSGGAAMNRKVQRRCIRERRARRLRDIGETRRDWFLLAEEGLSPAFSGDSPRGFELRLVSDIRTRSTRSGSDRRGGSSHGSDLCRERGKIAVKLLRAHGGCLGVRRRGVEVCDKPGGADKQASIPGCLNEPRELKHLSTWRKRKKNRFRQ
jgi:hypothetical protein